MDSQRTTLDTPWFERLAPSMGRHAREFQHTVYAKSALDSKAKVLIAVAVSSFQRCAHSTDGHLARAKQAGATPDEIGEALVMASLLVSGTQLHRLKDAFETALGQDGGAPGREPYFVQQAPAMGKAWASFNRAVYQPSAIDLKTKELIAIVLASLGRCPHCTRAHLAKARQAGASRAEIAEAMLVSACVASATEVHCARDAAAREGAPAGVRPAGPGCGAGCARGERHPHALPAQGSHPLLQCRGRGRAARGRGVELSVPAGRGGPACRPAGVRPCPLRRVHRGRGGDDLVLAAIRHGFTGLHLEAFMGRTDLAAIHDP